MTPAFVELEAFDEAALLAHAAWLGLLLDRELTHHHDNGIEFPFPQRNLTLRNPEAVVEAFLDRSQATRETFQVVAEPK